MKILFVISLPSSLSDIASAFSRINFFANHFNNKNNEVTISGIFDPLAREKGKKEIRNGIKNLNIVPFILKLNAFSFLFNILSLIFTFWIPYVVVKPEVIIISVPPGESALSSFIFAKIFRIKKIIFDYRDEWEDYAIKRSNIYFYKISYRLLKLFMNRCYSSCDLVITVTEPLAERLMSRGVNNVKVIPNGADVNIFKPLDSKRRKSFSRRKMGLRDEDFVIVYSGIIGDYYNLEVVIKAIKLISAKLTNLKLVMIGEGLDIKKILDLIDRLELKNTVLYLGKKNNKNELSEIISSSDIGLIPYDDNPLWKNSLPVKSFEYFACGLPVIATVYQDSILGNLIKENNIGLICEPENVNDLSKSIENMFYDKEFVEIAGKKAVSLIHEHYDRNKIAEEFLRLIEDK